MPIKLGKSVRKTTRGAAKQGFNYEHDYIKTKSTTALIEKFNARNTRPKDRQKIRNELVKRGGVEFNRTIEQTTATIS
jgi:predicted flavoprotein YhiN|tara:strand:+ start:64 stop:297 length:234 start_codon:yes stop_codon:yes gene_type:complete